MIPPPLVVGFDLDMTLIDSRPGIGAVLEVLSAETGVAIDVGARPVAARPASRRRAGALVPRRPGPGVADRFRALYPELAIEPTLALPGRSRRSTPCARHGGRSVVVTRSTPPTPSSTSSTSASPPMPVEGWRWAEAKGEALVEHGARSTSGTTRATSRAPARQVPSPSGSRPAARRPRTSRRRARTSCSTPSTAFPEWLAEHLLTVRLAALDEHLRSLGSVVVAFSGGADSAFLLAAAVRALGPYQVVAATAVSDSLASGELEAAAAFAAGLDVRHLTPRTYEMAREGYRANAGDRCYFCKAELLDVLRPVADRLAVVRIATGTNADDAVAGFRPGIRAADERGAVTPLRDAGLTKAQIREASRRWGLVTWDKPQAACLSSRVAYGIEITPDRLARVDRAEAALRLALDTACIDVHDLRVRDLGDGARIEVDADQVEAVLADPAVLEAVLEAGFDEAVIDPQGFRSGSMNERLTPRAGLG